MTKLIVAAPVSPLRQRLIDDMNMRRFSHETQRNYIRDVGRFATFLGRSPATATAEDVRLFQVEQRETGVPAPTMNESEVKKLPSVILFVGGSATDPLPLPHGLSLETGAQTARVTARVSVKSGHRPTSPPSADAGHVLCDGLRSGHRLAGRHVLSRGCEAP